MFLRSNKLHVFAVTALVGLVLSAVAEAKKPAKPPGDDSSGTYKIVKLDDDGTWECFAQDVNDLGNVVGYVTEDSLTSEQYAAYWQVSRSGEDVQSELTLLAGGGWAFGINNAGEIVGYGKDPTGRNMGLYWAGPRAMPMLLPSLTDTGHTTAMSINDDGVVCGVSDGQAVAWRVNWSGGEPSVWGPVVLPTLDEKSRASAIGNSNEDGLAQIAGVFRAANNRSTGAVSWTVQSQPDGSLAVDPLPRIIEAGEVEVFGVNDAGTVCGEAGWPTQATVWTQTESLTLNLARRLLDASAKDINNNGFIVGWGSTGVIDNKAAVWPSADASMVLLDKYLPRKSPPFDSLKEAVAVNELGEIVGVGRNGLSYGAFLAIPE